MWEGETIVKLMNGQIWQQTEYHYDYHYAYMPNVLVYRPGGGYKMKVDGTEEAVDEGSVRPCVATAWQANRLQNQWQGWEGLRPRSVQVRRVRYTWPWNTVLVLPPGSEPLMVSLGP